MIEKITYNRSRVIGFSDAVFSVAMTLLVLEVTIPTYESFKNEGTTSVLLERTPSFIGFVLSFFVTVFYWIDYMRISKYISDFDNKALWINILILFSIVLLPFSTAFYVNGFSLTGPFVFYSINLAFIAFFEFLLAKYITKKEEGKTGLTQLKGKWESFRSLNTSIIWLLSAIFAFILPWPSRFFFVFIFILEPFIDRYYKKRIQKEEKEIF